MTRAWVAILGLLPLLLAYPATAQEPAVPTKAFAGDQRLQKHLTVRRRFVTLNDLLREIGTATGVSLRARGRIASENVVALTRDRPAAEVLEVLQTTLGYRWARLRAADGARKYELYQDEEDQRAEEQARLERRQGALRRIHEVCVLRSGTDQRAHDDALGALENRLRATDLPAEEQKALAWERQELSIPLGYQPSETELLGMVVELWPRLEESFLRGERVALSTSADGPAQRLPARIASRILAVLAAEPEWSARVAAAPRDIEVQLHVRVDWTPTGARLNARWDVGLPPATELGEDATGFRRGKSFNVALPPTRGGKAEEVISDDPRLQQRVRLTIPEKYPPHLIADDPSTYFNTTLPVDVFSLLHDAQPELSFIGDAYIRPWAAPKSSGTVLELLNSAILSTGSMWRWDERGYVTTRSRNVPDDRIASVPAPLFQTLYQRAEKHKGMTLPDYAWLATALTDEQLMPLCWQNRPSLIAFLPGTSLTWYPLFEQRRLLRLYYSLNAKQLAALEARGLNASQLSRPQLEILDAELDEARRLVNADRALTGKSLEALTFTLQRKAAGPKPYNSASVTLAWRVPDNPEPVAEIHVHFNRW